MSEDGQREPGERRHGSSWAAGNGTDAAERWRGESVGDGQDHASTPRPDALIPALDEGQLAALREIGREW